ESLAFRIEQLERRGPGDAIETQAAAEPQEPTPSAPTVELEQLQDVWQRAVIPAGEQRSIPTASLLRGGHPTGLAGDTLTLEFPATAGFHRNLAEEPKNATLLADALSEVTGRRFSLALDVARNG